MAFFKSVAFSIFLSINKPNPTLRVLGLKYVQIEVIMIFYLT
jgi:hypothetical protein